MASVFNAFFHPVVLPVTLVRFGLGLRMTRYSTLSAACSLGKWPRARTARRMRALRLSIVILSFPCQRVRDLRVHVVDGVRDADPQGVRWAVRAA
jgi:hypothetical protein